MMKKIIIIFALVLAACIFAYRQPEQFYMNVENNEFNIYMKNEYLYFENDKVCEKLINEKIIDFKASDIDSDKNDEIVILTKQKNEDVFGKDIVVYDTKLVDGAMSVKELYRQNLSEIKPWAVDVCNLDNDGQADIFIGVYKDTVFYDDVRKRPFFYSWDGERLYKKWLGSFFSQWDLVDITFGDYFNLGYDVAAVLERNTDDEYRVGFYNFVGFGFTNMATSSIYKHVKTIETISENKQDYVYIIFKGIKQNVKLKL